MENPVEEKSVVPMTQPVEGSFGFDESDELSTVSTGRRIRAVKEKFGQLWPDGVPCQEIHILEF
jgi:hypothetical protein